MYTVGVLVHGVPYITYFTSLLNSTLQEFRDRVESSGVEFSTIETFDRSRVIQPSRP